MADIPLSSTSLAHSHSNGRQYDTPAVATTDPNTVTLHECAPAVAQVGTGIFLIWLALSVTLSAMLGYGAFLQVYRTGAGTVAALCAGCAMAAFGKFVMVLIRPR